MTLEQDAGAGRAISARGDDDDADRADGLLQPDLRLRRRRSSSTTPRRPASTGSSSSICRRRRTRSSACRRSKAGLNFIRLATPTTDDKRLPAVLANTSGFVYYVSITGVTGAAAPEAGNRRRGGCAHQAPYPSACRGRLRRARRGERGGDRGARRWRGGRLGAGRGGAQGAGRGQVGAGRSRRRSWSRELAAGVRGVVKARADEKALSA